MRALLATLLAALASVSHAQPAAEAWKPVKPYDEERDFVAPSATTQLAAKPRIVVSKVTDAKQFKGNVSPKIIIDNPYLDPLDPFFNIPRSMACTADGGLVVASTAKLAKSGRFAGTPYAMGFWRIAPTGQITALAAKHRVVENTQTYPVCDVPFAKSRLSSDVVAITRTNDGGILFAAERVIFKLTTTGRVELVPHAKPSCAPPGLAKPATTRFRSTRTAVEDPRGAIWVADPDACALHRIEPDGTTKLVLDRAVVCPKNDPHHHIVMDHLAWDGIKDELVVSGSLYWGTAPKTNVYSPIWRVTRDGRPRRVYLGLKLGKEPVGKRVDGIGGLALDGKGRIHFGAGIAEASGAQIRRLDEATGTAIVVAGTTRPTDVKLTDGPARTATFGVVRDLCFAPDGTLFTNDAGHVIRKLTPAGQVTTWAF